MHQKQQTTNKVKHTHTQYMKISLHEDSLDHLLCGSCFCFYWLFFYVLNSTSRSLMYPQITWVRLNYNNNKKNEISAKPTKYICDFECKYYKIENRLLFLWIEDLESGKELRCLEYSVISNIPSDVKGSSHLLYFECIYHKFSLWKSHFCLIHLTLPPVYKGKQNKIKNTANE